jgi:cytochrome c oxidase subunit 1
MPKSAVRSYLFSTDHKIIGIQYLLLSLVAVLTGIVLSVFMRTRLAWPDEKWPLLQRLMPEAFAGGPMTPEFYLSMMTMHGTIMVFFVLTTAPLSGFGNYFLPIQIGARRGHPWRRRLARPTRRAWSRPGPWAPRPRRGGGSRPGPAG